MKSSVVIILTCELCVQVKSSFVIIVTCGLCAGEELCYDYCNL